MSQTEPDETNLQNLNEQIYKHSLELAEVNKTLSLLRKLYQISMQALEPAAISEKISEAIRLDLNMELVGILIYDAKSDRLHPLKFALSPRAHDAQMVCNVEFNQLSIESASTNALFKSALKQRSFAIVNDLHEIWQGTTSVEIFAELADQSHIKTAAIEPLLTEKKIIGAIIFGFNRESERLTDFEKDSINLFNDVVAVALDNALLYEQLRIANEQLQALDRARAEFISIASHQLRTPPSTIKWYLNAVLAGDFGELPPDIRAALQRANVTNETQISTISDLLNASRIERGKLEFFFQPANIEPIVKSLVDQLEPLAEMHKQRIVYNKPKVVIPDLIVDQEKIRQVINNLIDNAIKYSKTGDITITLDADSERVTVKVSDQGKGISKDDMKMLFSKYSRGKDSATHATGLGLGLHVAKVVIDQHHGKIWAESEGLGRGATFAFSIPIQNQVQATSVVDLTKSTS